MDSVQLAGVALAALLSENFILVNCLGIGTRVEAFHSTTAARRTGLSLTLAMVVTVFFTWCADFLVLRHFGWCICAPWSSPSLPSSLSSCCERQPVSGRSSPIESTPTWPRYPPTVRCWVRPIWPPSAATPCPRPLTFALCGGLGVLVVLMSYAGLREEISLTSCPRPFRGPAIEMVTAGLMALALVGFYGLHLS